MNIQRPVSKQPIPSNAKCVFKGKIFDIYQWNQKMFDGSTILFEKIKRDDTVNVLPVVNGKIILTKQEQPGTEPFIGAAGGRIDEGELPLEAVERELLEETGFSAEKFILWDAVQPVEKIDWAVYTFIAKKCRQIRNPKLESGEKIKLLSVSFEEFLSITADEKYRDGEITLKILRALNNPQKIEEWRKLFLE